MNPAHISRRLAKGAYRTTRFFVGLLAALAILAVFAFVFLRIHGVPAPLLREVMRRVNAAGIPVQAEKITLTLHGWRADQVCYYSANPDDLEPLFVADKVYFSVRNSRMRDVLGPEAWSLDVKAVEVGMNPSVEWGVSIPRESPFRHVEQLEASLGFLPDRVLLSHGSIIWHGSSINVNVNGTILKGQPKATQTPPRKQHTLFPTRITEQRFHDFNEHLKMLLLPKGAVVDIGFLVDTFDYSASRADVSINVEDLELKGVGFAGARITGSYAFPLIKAERMTLLHGTQSIQLSGEYNLTTKEWMGGLSNSITSRQLLTLLPKSMNDLLGRIGLEVGQIPRLEVEFGPAVLDNILNRFSAVFSVYDLGYQGVEIEALRGKAEGKDGRVEFTKLEGSVRDQADRAAETGSCMQGGTAEGSAFWDGNTHEFAVEADANFDPNLLVQALSPVETATNVIRRFRFKGLPPRGHISLGADADDWGTFFIDIQALANDVVFQGVEFSSMNVTQTYRHGKLSLDPVAAMQGVDFIKGSALIDLRRSLVSFDALSSVNPADLEDLIYPGLNLFGNHIVADGDIRIAAQGTFDWGSMQQTDFSATVEAERLTIPVAELGRFKAKVEGNGSVVAVNNALFGLYGGDGQGEFSFRWNPPGKKLPYSADFSFSKADFHSCLAFLCGDKPIKVAGTMSGNARIEADFSTNFFATANGKGFVRVDDGQLADLPLFAGFSRLVRKVFPSFTVFSITSLNGNFVVEDGAVSSGDAYFEGNVLSAKGRGSYVPKRGFDAYVQAQIMSEGAISRVVRAITDPLMKLLELKLEGTLSDPSWRLEKF